MAAIIERRIGHLPDGAMSYNVVVRTKLGALDLVCSEGGSVKTAESAAAVLDARRDLRAY